MRRGDLVSLALSGDNGKPRPAVIVQADHFAPLPSVTVLPLTSEMPGEHLVRITVYPSEENGLKAPSQIMVDKVSAVPRAKVRQRIGQMDAATMNRVKRALTDFLGLV